MEERSEIARELNAVYGLLHVAYERGYPRTLIAQLRVLLTKYETALNGMPPAMSGLRQY